MNFDDVRDYEMVLGKSHKYYVKYKVRVLVEILEKYFNCIDELRILDLGCGTGEAEEYLNSVHAFGVDISKNMLKKAKNKKLKSAQFVVGNAVNLPFKDDKFDVVFSFSLLHHIPRKNRKQCYLNVERILKQKGLLIIAEHNPMNPVTRHKFKTCPIDKDAVMLSSKEIKKEVKGSALKVIEEKNIIFFPPFIGKKLFKIEKIFSKIPLGGQYVIVCRKEC